MDKRGRRLYSKAMEKYNKGYIDESLKLCDKALNKNKDNSAILNLKGIIYYEKGDLGLALNVWKYNFSVNDDKISEMYIKDAVKDKARLEIYNQAYIEIKNFKIHEAIEKLESCTKSDFNMINVNNSLCYCFIKTGDYKNAKRCLERVLSVDKKNKTALENRKILKEYGEDIKGTVNAKVIVISAAIVAVIAAGVLGAPKIKSYVDSKKLAEQQKEKQEQDKKKQQEEQKKKEEQQKKEAADKKKQEESKKEQDRKKSSLDSSKLLTAIDNDDFEYVDNVLSSVDKSLLNMNDKNSYDKAESYIYDKGVAGFYKKGSKYFESGEYKDAEKELLSAYKYSSKSYLRPHIQFILANTYEKMNNIEEACKYFEEFRKENIDKESSDYMDEVLYKLAIYNKSSNVEKAKQYAEELEEKYPDSMYINSKLKEILN